ncbi:MAG: hypothetical protein U5K77_01425 [Candidatus Saccharibacteria bacterium]|nr:hypothetical protein [Candidatus Saccharibacteria bacterium]
MSLLEKAGSGADSFSYEQEEDVPAEFSGLPWDSAALIALRRGQEVTRVPEGEWCAGALVIHASTEVRSIQSAE